MFVAIMCPKFHCKGEVQGTQQTVSVAPSPQGVCKRGYHAWGALTCEAGPPLPPPPLDPPSHIS